MTVAVVAVVSLCLRTGVGSEYQRLQEWSESSLVPPSLRSLSRKRRERIFVKLRMISLQKMFKKLNLDPAFAESCAAVGIATLGDLLLLRPVFLRDLGFGVTEKQHIMRTIERRAQIVEDLIRAGDETIELESGVATEIEEACLCNEGQVDHYLVKPVAELLRLHANKVSEASRIAALLRPVGAGEVLSEQVSRIFWDFFRSEFAQHPQEGIEPPLISIAADNRRSARLSKAFYLRVRRRWEEAQKRLVVLRVQFVSTFNRVSFKHAPVPILVNEQFWLGFVLRWNLQQERQVKERALERAKKEAKERLKIAEYEAALAATRSTRHSTAFMIASNGLSAAAATPREMVKKLKSLFSPLSRLVKTRAADTKNFTSSAAHPNPNSAAAPLPDDDGTSSDWSLIDAIRSDDDSADSDRGFDVISKTPSMAMQASTDDDTVDIGDSSGMALADADRERAELLELDPFLEGCEAPKLVGGREEVFSVAVSFGRFLSAEEYEGHASLLENMQLFHLIGSHAEEDELLQELAKDVHYATTVTMWNRYVHEFHRGEIGVQLVSKRPQTTSPSSTDGEEMRTYKRFEPKADEVTSYLPPVVPGSAHTSSDTVQLHIVSVTNTSERFDEVRRKLNAMRDSATLGEWRGDRGAKSTLSSGAAGSPLTTAVNDEADSAVRFQTLKGKDRRGDPRAAVSHYTDAATPYMSQRYLSPHRAQGERQGVRWASTTSKKSSPSNPNYPPPSPSRAVVEKDELSSSRK